MSTKAETTAVLISGGVDSAVAVHRLHEQGIPMHLFYIRIGMDTDEGDCSAEEDIEMCALIAHKYGLPFDVVCPKPRRPPELRPTAPADFPAPTARCA